MEETKTRQKEADQTTPEVGAARVSSRRQPILGASPLCVSVCGRSLILTRLRRPPFRERRAPLDLTRSYASSTTVFGETNPWGKLPATMYHANYTPEVAMDNMSMVAGFGRSYKCYTRISLFPFGFEHWRFRGGFLSRSRRGACGPGCCAYG